MRCNDSAAVGFEHDGAQREQRGRGATCAHQPVDETKSNEDQKLCDGGDRSNQLVAPPRDISLDDVDETREQRGRDASCAHRPADETESSEGQDSVATGWATCDAMFLPRSGSSTTERSASSGGGARRVRTDPRTRPSRTRTRSSATVGIAPISWLHHLETLPWTMWTRSASSEGGARRVRTDPLTRSSRTRTRSSATVGVALISWLHHHGPLPWTTRTRSARDHVILRSSGLVKCCHGRGEL